MDRLSRESVKGDDIWNYQHSLTFRSYNTSVVFPNFFITTATAEWTFPMHCSSQQYYSKDYCKTRGHDASAFGTIHMYQVIRDSIAAMLHEENSQWFQRVSITLFDLSISSGALFSLMSLFGASPSIHRPTISVVLVCLLQNAWRRANRRPRSSMPILKRFSTAMWMSNGLQGD